jgi:hypothetical protein
LKKYKTLSCIIYKSGWFLNKELSDPFLEIEALHFDGQKANLLAIAAPNVYNDEFMKDFLTSRVGGSSGEYGWFRDSHGPDGKIGFYRHIGRVALWRDSI